MKVLSAAILIACVPFSAASAQLGKDASYFCVAEFAGGLIYDEGMKKWKSGALRIEEKFVLRLKHLRTRVQKSYTGEDEPVHDYDVTVTPAGSNAPFPCVSYGQRHVAVRLLSSVWCDGLDLQVYKFNLITNRFLSSYLVGYVDGDHNKQNTPSVTGGTCTKID